MFVPDNKKLIAEFTVKGEPASKANSRRLVMIHGKPRIIKSDKALKYQKVFEYQCPKHEIPTVKPVIVVANIWYASRRPDLDESIILDGMQGRIYINDRQVVEKHMYRKLDPKNPRADIRVYLA